jgi:hypothetical protein
MKCKIVEADFLTRRIILEVCEDEELVVSATVKELVEGPVGEALRFYADKQNYGLHDEDIGYVAGVMEDGGRRARTALDGEELV